VTESFKVISDIWPKCVSEKKNPASPKR